MRSLATFVAGIVVFGAALGVRAGGQTSSSLPGNMWPPARAAVPGKAPVLSPVEALETFSVPPGFHVELVAAEPLVESPIIIDFDADGRMWVVEMPAFLPDSSGRDSREPINRVVVLEDTDDDGRMDRRTVFADGLVMPRALKVLDRGVLVGEPPNLWLMRDVDGDLKADTKDLVAGGFGNANANIEHNANALFWAMDNVMYASEHTWDLRLRGQAFETVPALSRGQWQISQDDAGRVFRNVNDAPLHVDYTPSRYFLRNPNVVRTRGLFELLIDQVDARIFPVRPTRGVNRGYRDPGPLFRGDGSATVIQGAGSPTIYRGDRYPPELGGNAFITDSPTNLVHRFVVEDDGTGRLRARNGYERGEFLASSDERFRPVNLASAPDGTLYVVDMYRGVVQAGGLWTDYLASYIRANDLLQPVGHGRIWRVVHGEGAGRRGPKPSLSRAMPAALVEALAHPNGWWRDTAQRLLVERGDRSVVPALEERVRAPDWRTRLHALWTLDGLDALGVPDVERALADVSAHVRASAVRLAEQWLAQPGHPLTARVLERVNDASWTVRRQVAASAGEIPAGQRVDAILRVLLRDGSDPIVVDAAVSGVRGLEGEVLARLLQTPASAAAPTEAVAMVTAALVKTGNAEAVDRVVAQASEPTRQTWQRLALLQGIDYALPSAPGARGRGIGLPGLSVLRAPTPISPGRGVSLPAEPTGLAVAASGTDEVALVARRVLAKLDWPGRPAPVALVPRLTPEEQRRYEAGAESFKNLCTGCHEGDGQARGGLAANLVASAIVTNADPTAVVRVLLGGKDGERALMPPMGGLLDDEQVAAVVTYIRRAWGHGASAVTPLEVSEVRALSRGRSQPWTDLELQQPTGRGGRGRGGP